MHTYAWDKYILHQHSQHYLQPQFSLGDSMHDYSSYLSRESLTLKHPKMTGCIFIQFATVFVKSPL